MKRFKRFIQSIKDLFIESSLPVDPSELLSRYIFTRKYLRADNSVKWEAFEPKNGKTSVFRISDLLDNEIWDIGNNVAIQSSRKLCGRADILTGDVSDTTLNVVKNEPPLRHANIIGWPDDESVVMQLALDLAEKAEGHRLLLPSHF